MFEEGSDQNQPAEQQQEAQQEATPQEQETGTPNAEGQLDQMLQGITNAEGRPKYSSVQQALGSIPHAQKHIQDLEQDNQTLKSEMDTLRQQIEDYKQQVERFGSLEDILEKREETKGMSQEELDQYFEQKLAQRESLATARQNQTSVVNSLVEMYGDKSKAEQEFVAMQNELGVDLQELAAKSPKAVLRYFQKPKADVPDKFDANRRQEFKPSGEKPKARMPRTTQESVSAWRDVGNEVRSKYGIE
ncbi:MAG: hypothetical protein OQK25_07865 [Gammaproteobacteria bacterium]|nr:hypothetical protein [Gammaproteobacteria bacterium]MCW8982491.1 hypothetical protein [Gammaproteobacteria bacterium]